MKTKSVMALVITTAITANVYAAPDKQPQDVNVVNTPLPVTVDTATPLPVTVQNPQTSVTIDNSEVNPVPVTVQNQASCNSGPQYVGFSSATFDGGQGVVTYTGACQQSFPGSHMCTSEEFLNTTAYPAVSGSGWIRPVYVPVTVTGGASTSTITESADMSGKIDEGTSGLACRGWNTTQGANGLTVDAAGRFQTQNCSTINAVACCQ